MKINIQYLEDGLHQFEEQTELGLLDERIKQYYPENAVVTVTVDKFGSDFRLDIVLTTHAHYICDRCLNPFEQAFKAHQQQLFHRGKFAVQPDEDIIELEGDAIEIDLDSLLAEMVLINHPIKMLCSEDCKGICPGCGADLNQEVCRCSEKPVDPRWASLQKLIK